MRHYAADGYARATGSKPPFASRLPVRVRTNFRHGHRDVIYGPVPIVFITGNVSTDLIGKDSFQEADITGITMPITKNNYLVKDKTSGRLCCAGVLPSQAADAPALVLVDIPWNVSAAVAEYTPAKPYKYKALPTRRLTPKG